MARTWMRRHWTNPLGALLFASTLAIMLSVQHYSPFSTVRLGRHTITPDGLLIVDPAGPHPIFELIRDAEAAWAEKQARASTTLDEAIQEYKWRYHRAPPRGFDKWWAYVVRHDVQLPDEYDEIYHDIEPFWGLDPAELARTQAALEIKPDLITFASTDGGPLVVVRSTLSPEEPSLMGRIENVLGLLRDVERDLPPLRFSLSPQDMPDMVSDWRIARMARQAAANGTVLVNADLPEVTEEGWIQACPPNTPAATFQFPPTSLENLSASMNGSPKTFIASHRATMDPCRHPLLLHTHGQFLAHKEGPLPQRTLVPRFSLCATMLHHDIRPPVPYGWPWDNHDVDSVNGSGDEDDEEDRGAFEGDLKWEQRVDERLGWRGRTTGVYASTDSWWMYGHRARLVTLANALEGNISVLHVPDEEEMVGEGEMRQRAHINPAWMDVAFTDVPIACDEQQCAEMQDMWEFRQVQRPHEEGRYKFILDVDGNAWSGRFKRLMTSHALVFKATIYPEWYTSRIAPWVHYVPIQVSYTDLYDALAFFRVHDQLARRIAMAGRAWSLAYWRREDMTAYFYRLLLEYARVSSLDRASMDYVE